MERAFFLLVLVLLINLEYFNSLKEEE